MSSNSSTKYCQKKQKMIPKKTREKYPNFMKKNDNLGISDMKISFKMKNKASLSIERIVFKNGKTLCTDWNLFLILIFVRCINIFRCF